MATPPMEFQCQRAMTWNRSKSSGDFCVSSEPSITAMSPGKPFIRRRLQPREIRWLIYLVIVLGGRFTDLLLYVNAIFICLFLLQLTQMRDAGCKLRQNRLH